MLKLGFLVNPYAGVGGPLGLKGSDGIQIQADNQVALTRRARVRATAVMEGIADLMTDVVVYTASGMMGQSVLDEVGLRYEVVYQAPTQTTAVHTRKAVKWIVDQQVDLLIFTGGDGTARDIAESIAEGQPVLGIPAGVKMHSAVFAYSSSAAISLLRQFLSGQLLRFYAAEVRDCDEDALRRGEVATKYYAQMWVPAAPEFVQNVKHASAESELLMIEEVAAEVVETLDDDDYVWLGPGSTKMAILRQLNLVGTPLGVDVLHQRKLLLTDANENQLWQLLSDIKDRTRIRLLITVIGGQGIVFGRGNQQFSPRILKQIEKKQISFLATVAKLEKLANQPLRLDTGDSRLDQSMSGNYRVIIGYQHEIQYPVKAG